MTEAIEVPIQIVLDASAVERYGRDEAVGEFIAELADEGLCFAVTEGSLAGAYARGAESLAIKLLCRQFGCVVVDRYPDWQSLGAWMRDACPRIPADLHDALVAWISLNYDAYIITIDPDRYTTIHPDVECLILA